MGTIRLPKDFKEFLVLLNAQRVEYMLVGGYAVGYHGYPRPTGDIDFWVAMNQENAERLVQVFKDFGFDSPDLSADLFLKEQQIVRIGVPPVRVEVLMGISGLEFHDCYEKRTTDVIDGVPINILSLQDLRVNKQAAGRYKDLDDLQNLPD
jgi:hypothetical protein